MKSTLRQRREQRLVEADSPFEIVSSTANARSITGLLRFEDDNSRSLIHFKRHTNEQVIQREYNELRRVAAAMQPVAGIGPIRLHDNHHVPGFLLTDFVERSENLFNYLWNGSRLYRFGGQMPVEQIGTKLTITPQISEGDTLILDISQEISSIAPSAQGAVDIVTNQRTIDTTVIVEDGDILVLGGLIEDTLRESDQRVPLLGSIPLLGNLFRARTTDKVKTNLLVFIRPRILRNSTQAAMETESKYNYIRDMQQSTAPRHGSQVPLMPGARRPTLPPLDLRKLGEEPEDDDQN